MLSHFSRLIVDPNRQPDDPSTFPEISDGIKQGFSAPDASWFRGDSIDYIRRTLFARDARIYEFLDRTATQALVEEHLSGARNRRLLIWSLLCVEQWCQLFLDGGRGGVA